MLSDPIAALATPPGRSAIAVVRISGRGALPVVAQVVRGLSLETLAPRMAHRATLFSPDGIPIDDGLVTIFRAPHSYTGEDLVELS
ncbi:MAG TPA: hypothetical protein VFU23_10535, partial [Gemmatimonadales bacterium]|nr:hypothetical protein [Gemmatimonadales bacterium]